MVQDLFDDCRLTDNVAPNMFAADLWAELALDRSLHYTALLLYYSSPCFTMSSSQTKLVWAIE